MSSNEFMPDSRPLPWKVAAAKATSESDTERFRHLVRAAETAIFFRLQELSSPLEHAEECDEINSALTELLELKIRKLGWPNPR
jgi:hypothetical protein